MLSIQDIFSSTSTIDWIRVCCIQRLYDGHNERIAGTWDTVKRGGDTMKRQDSGVVMFTQTRAAPVLSTSGVLVPSATARYDGPAMRSCSSGAARAAGPGLLNETYMNCSAANKGQCTNTKSARTHEASERAERHPWKKSPDAVLGLAGAFVCKRRNRAAPKRTLFTDKVDLERLQLVQPHPGLAVFLAEHIQLDALDEHEVLLLVDESEACGD